MSPARILVVDDNTADITLFCGWVLDQHKEAYVLQILTSGDEALHFVYDHRRGTRAPEPCVILLDLHLPKYDGLAILQAIRSVPALGHIQVVVLSGLASPHERESITSMGAVYRQKPFDLDEYAVLGAEILEICRDSGAKNDLSQQWSLISF